MKLVDPYNRRLNYLRISITDRCNLSCLYCSPRHQIPKLSHEDILSYEEILRLVRIGVQLGISKVRITGGEPLVRKGVHEFIQALHQVDGIRDVSLTTNGVLLKDHVNALIDAGLHRINISLDTLKPDKFKKITGLDAFDRVWEGIQRAYQGGLSPIKVNTVALRHFNDNELEDIARLSFIYPFHFRFIEYMPIGTPEAGMTSSLHTPEIKQRLTDKIGELIPVEHQLSDGPAERFRFEGAIGEIGFISAMSHHFCHTCNRLRLTASGQLRSCLLSDHQEDLKTPLRSGASDEALSAIFLKAASMKGVQHGLTADTPVRISGQMSSIGG
ncbi:MAG: GTP 3',8-cyclase MoaA [Deltaproteobacteria bacterium]|nr:GTP 3',8-cyclase MoaA [Deltaproteobacteria bacterium]